MSGLVPSARVGLIVGLGIAISTVALVAKSTGHPRRRAIDAVIIHSLGGPDCQNGTRFFKRIGSEAKV